MGYIDLRSDTVTQPTAGMRQAIANAKVGDDVWSDDPTVNLLQETVADLLGKEAALYVPSGTMGNQLALKAQTRPGDQLVMEDGCHIYRYEGGAPAALCGLLATNITSLNGSLTWSAISEVLNPDDVHSAPPTIISVENTHNRAGGLIFPQSQLVEIGQRAHARNLRVHLDGARLWHAHIATGLSLQTLAEPVDTVMVCFSKALGAPVGSILAGDKETIQTAHRYRKMWGGGMRQAGILAAGCLYALENHLELLADDHAAAQNIFSRLENSLLKVNHPVDTNIVIIDVTGVDNDVALVACLKDNGILGIGFGPGRVRLIPNLGVCAADIERTISVLNSFPGDQG